MTRFLSSSLVTNAVRVLKVRALAIGVAVSLFSASAQAQQAYQPPVESAATISKVRFAEGHSIGESFQARFSDCDAHNTCLKKAQACSTDKSRNKALLQLRGGTIFFEAKMAIDTDGSKLSRTLYAARRKAGKRVIDQPDTSLRYPDNSSLDADTVPYIAVPGGGFRDALGIEKGDIVSVVYKDRIAYALVGDVGPACKIGEGSLSLHEELGNKACLARDAGGVCTRASDHSIESGVLYFVFPASHEKILSGLSAANINDRIKMLGPELMKQLETPP